ncbi:MAG: copper chaperone PCu(A)C [Rhizomicrobium sp.]
MRTLLSAALIALAATPVLAADLTVTDAWFRSLPAHLPAGGYLVVHNAGSADAVLTAASSPACASIMLHKSENTNGMSGMVMADSVTVPAHGEFAFRPGAYHLMCMKPAMTIGTNVPVTLEFASGAKITAAFRVKNARGT